MPYSKLSMPQLANETRLESLVVREYGAHHVTLTLSRPEVHNALDAPLVELLLTVVSSLKNDVRTVTLEGEGPSFCAGADLRGWDPNDGKEAVSAESLSQLLSLMRTQKQIFVARVHGVAAAGGAGLAAACDIVIATQDTRFSFPEVRLGLVPAVISPYIERAVGAARTRYWFLTASPIEAHEAHKAGLVHMCVEMKALDDAVLHCLHALWRGGPSALAESKWLLDDLRGLGVRAREERCKKTLERVRHSTEAHEGIRSFFARDTPNWRLS